MSNENEVEPGDGERWIRCRECDGRGVHNPGCLACKGTGRQPAPQPFAAAIGSVAASLPTNPADEALIDRLMAKRAGKPAVPAEKEREESRFTSHAAEILHLRSQLAAANAENERLKAALATTDTGNVFDWWKKHGQLREALRSELIVQQAEELSALTAEAARLRDLLRVLREQIGFYVRSWESAGNAASRPQERFAFKRCAQALSDVLLSLVDSALEASAGGQGKEGT